MPSNPSTHHPKQCRSICLIALLTLFTLPDFPLAGAQPAPSDSTRMVQRVGFSGGGTHLAHQDLIHTPFVHGGTSPISFGLHYSRTGKRGSRFAEGRYSALASRLGAPYDISHGDHGHDNLPHGFLFFELACGAGRKVNSGSRHVAEAGVSARFDLQAVFYRYGADENFGYFISTGLNLWYGRSYALAPRHLLKGRLEAPVVTWLARSPYLVNDDRFIENIASNDQLKIVLAFLADGAVVSWNRLQRLHSALDYEFAVTRRFGAGLSYRFSFTRSTEPRPVISYHNTLNLTTTFRF